MLITSFRKSEMIFKRFYLAFVTMILLSAFSCEGDEVCNIEPALLDCIGFPSLGFVITRNGENIFNENTTTIQDIAIQGDDARNVELNLQSGFDSINGDVLFFTDLDWARGAEHTYVINVKDTDSFSLNTSLTISEGPCCGGIPILEEIQINNSQGAQDSQTGFYNISLD